MTPDKNHPRLHPETIATVLKAAKIQKPAELTDLEKLQQRAKLITLEVREQIKPVLEAGGNDPKGLAMLVQKLYLERLHKLSKDEMLLLLTMIHTDIMLEQIL